MQVEANVIWLKAPDDFIFPPWGIIERETDKHYYIMFSGQFMEEPPLKIKKSEAEKI